MEESCTGRSDLKNMNIPTKDDHFLDQVKHGGHRPGTLPHQSHVGGVSAKVGYVLAHPQQRQALIPKSEVAGSFVGSQGQPTERAKPVVYPDQDNIAVKEYLGKSNMSATTKFKDCSNRALQFTSGPYRAASQLPTWKAPP